MLDFEQSFGFHLRHVSKFYTITIDFISFDHASLEIFAYIEIWTSWRSFAS